MPEKIYVIYLPRGGVTTVDLKQGPLAARWFNPRSGEFGQPAPATNSRQTFSAADTNDWALLVEPRNPSNR